MKNNRNSLKKTTVGVVCLVVAITTARSYIYNHKFADDEPDSNIRSTQELTKLDSHSADSPFRLLDFGDVASEPVKASEPGTQSTSIDKRESNSAVTDVLVHRAQSDSDTLLRYESIAELGATSDSIAELILVDLLYDPESGIREAAVESLGTRASQGAIQGLGFALTDENKLVRMTALEMLTEIGTPEAIGTIAVTLDDQDPGVRLSAVTELADTRGEPATALLLNFMADNDTMVRRLAAQYLNDWSY